MSENSPDPSPSRDVQRWLASTGYYDETKRSEVLAAWAKLDECDRDYNDRKTVLTISYKEEREQILAEIANKMSKVVPTPFILPAKRPHSASPSEEQRLHKATRRGAAPETSQEARASSSATARIDLGILVSQAEKTSFFVLSGVVLFKDMNAYWTCKHGLLPQLDGAYHNGGHMVLFFNDPHQGNSIRGYVYLSEPRDHCNPFKGNASMPVYPTAICGPFKGVRWLRNSKTSCLAPLPKDEAADIVYDGYEVGFTQGMKTLVECENAWFENGATGRK